MITEKQIEEAATKYAERNNSAYANDLYGFSNGATWAYEQFKKGVLAIRMGLAAYQGALEYDHCPIKGDAEKLPDEILTPFSVDDFRNAADNFNGRRPSEIIDAMISWFYENDKKISE